MKKFNFLFISIFTFLIFSFGFVQANDVGTAAGSTLLRTSGARASALGDAFTAMDDDITALEFNPGSLATLKSGNASLQHQTGLFNDSFSKALVGWKTGMGALGVLAGRYDSGRANLFDGVNQQSVTAEQDWTGTIGYGRTFGKFNTGTSIRYFSSKLANSYSASAVSVDVGAQLPISEKLRIGFSGPLIQSKLKYTDVRERLPKVYRLGLATDVSMNLATGRLPLKLLFDTPFDSNAHRFSAALGAETQFGPLAFRLGYNEGLDANNFSVGAGFALSQFTIDYSFGLVNNDFNSLHRVSFSMRFGQTSNASEVQAPKKADRQVVLIGNSDKENSLPAAKNSTVLTRAQAESLVTPESRSNFLKFIENKNRAAGTSYVVKKGDTLKDIAMQIYGDDSWSALILFDNRDKIKDPDVLPIGKKLKLP